MDTVRFIIHILLYIGVVLQWFEIRNLKRENRALHNEMIMEQNREKMRQYRIAWRKKQ